MVMPPASKLVSTVLLCLALAACKSDSERADDYYNDGLQLLESGDTDRALVQFRNAFEFEDSHLEARTTLGDFYLEQGNLRAAFAQYRKIAEQFPEEFEAQRHMAEIAFTLNSWDDFTRYGAVVTGMNPDDPRVQAIDLGMKYREAVLDEDDPARQALSGPAEALLLELPDSRILNNMLADTYVRDANMDKALERVDALIENSPENRRLYIQRLGMLAENQDMPAIEEHLRTMVEQFPGDIEIQGMLFRFYVSQQRLDQAEAFLREISDPTDENPALFLSLINFVSETAGEEAARAEIERAIALNPKPDRFKAMLAMMDFQAGKQDQAIADVEAVLASADPAEPETQGIKNTLARMLVSTGNQVGARQLVEEVLAANPSNVDALKMQSVWQLREDEVDAALSNLRLALDTSPEDIEVMNLMYQAYTRLGETDLAREFLALAVETSGNAPEPSLRYARLLINEERLLPAEDVLLPALRQSPRNADLLSLLGTLYLRMDDMPRATQVVDTLQRMDTEQSRTIANGLQAEMLNRQSGTEEALKFLETLATGDDATLREQVVLVRARLQTGETDEALQLARQLAGENPDNLGMKEVLATAQLAADDLDGARVTLREVTAAAPARAVQSWLRLVRISLRQGDPDGADALIEEALAATGNNANIMLAKAGRFERKGEIEEAIAIYETLYAQNPGSIILANNLASLITSYRDDAESLERAWVIARRLRDSDVPAIQDTYGWIQFRRGNAEEALPYLESAAAQLEDPMVQAHLAFTYAALERNAEALAQMEKAVELAGPADTRDRIEAARAEIPRLRGLVENR